MYIIAKRIEYFSKIKPVIIYIESPIIKHTKVVTLLASEEKKLTLGKRQMPSKAYAMKTGRNSTKKLVTFAIDNLMSSYMSTSFL
jgi:hypothetical protein